jgi:hypothetical protein
MDEYARSYVVLRSLKIDVGDVNVESAFAPVFFG